MVRSTIAGVMLGVAASAASAQSPPARMPPHTVTTAAQPVVIYDAAGNVVSPFGGGPVSPPASSAIGVQRTGSIGTTGTLVSPADAASRRTVTNTSTIACELMGAAGAYGTGYPLPAGMSFTFDASGRTTAALYVACASAGGAVAVLSY